MARFRNYVSTLQSIVRTNAFLYSVATLLNVILFVCITSNTQLASWAMGFVFASSIAITCIASKMFLNRLGLFISLCIAPLIVNLFFLINYVLASHPVNETYRFEHELEWYGGRKGHAHLDKKAYIILEDNRYQDIHFFRMFADFDAMKDAQQITYTFQDGPFGFRVLKAFRFE